MNAALLWTAIGAVAAIPAVGVGVWQLRLAVLDRRERRHQQSVNDELSLSGTAELPVAVPVGRLPAEVCGRETILAELRRRRSRREGGVWVLAGMGGVGKSTVALAVAASARAKGCPVWWVNATDNVSLAGGVLEMLHQLAAPESVARPVRQGAPTAAERTWQFLNGTRAARRGLLVFDNADDPAVLAAAGDASPAAGTGWLRPGRSRVMVVVTTRAKDRQVWGTAVTMRDLQPLQDDAAAKVLADLAPDIEDPSGTEAVGLAHRLGGLPLALHLAGAYLASPFARWRSFAEYRAALDGSELPDALADLDDPGAHARSALQRTWDLSLDTLAEDGRPQARQLLFLLCCYAPVTPIPAVLVQAEPIEGLLGFGSLSSEAAAGGLPGDVHRRLREGLRALAGVGLIEVTGSSRGADEAVAVHLVVADVNRSRLLTTARSDLPAIIEAAVCLLQNASGQLDFRLPADWTAWRQLAPHVAAVLGWLANCMDHETLVMLLDISDATARALLRSGDLAAADRLVRSGAIAAARLGGQHPADLAARCSLANLIRWQGRYSEAELLHRQVLAGQQRLLGYADPATLRTRHNLAWGMAGQGRYAEAEQLHREVLPDRRRVLGDDHPDTLDTRLKLALVIARQGRYGEAEQLYQQLKLDNRRALGSDHPDTLAGRHGLAEVIAAQGRFGEAERLYRQVLADRQALLGHDHPDTLESGHGLAEVIAAQGRFGEAERLYRQVLADRQAQLGHDHPDALESGHGLAEVIAAQGRFGEAERLYRQVLAVRERLLGHDHSDTTRSRNALGQVITRPVTDRPE